MDGLLIDLPRQYNPTLTRLVSDTLFGLSVPVRGLEFPIRDLIAERLAKELRLSDGFRVDTEVTFADGCRADVMVREAGKPSVIVEVKKRGPDVDALLAQVGRYAAHIGGIVVAVPGYLYGFRCPQDWECPVRVAVLSSWRVVP